MQILLYWHWGPLKVGGHWQTLNDKQFPPFKHDGVQVAWQSGIAASSGLVGTQSPSLQIKLVADVPSGNLYPLAQVMVHEVEEHCIFEFDGSGGFCKQSSFLIWHWGPT